MGTWQSWRDKWAKWWNIINQSQTNQSPRPARTCDSYANKIDVIRNLTIVLKQALKYKVSNMIAPNDGVYRHVEAEHGARLALIHRLGDGGGQDRVDEAQ